MAKDVALSPADLRAAITEITVAGFKSIRDEQRIVVRPLTILAGANSSGKSSMMQPLLLLKQTLEAGYDPGPLLLNGPNVKFTKAEQLLARTGPKQSSDIFVAGVGLESGSSFQTSFRKEHGSGFRIEQMTVSGRSREGTVWPAMTHPEVLASGVIRDGDPLTKSLDGLGAGQWEITRDRCFLELSWVVRAKAVRATPIDRLAAEFLSPILDTIHVPGFRGSPERAYPVAGVGGSYPGTFEKYTASVIAHWAERNQTDELAELSAEMKRLSLTGGISAVRVNDAQIELHVGRLPNVAPKKPEDRVNIADVGFGVSQALPVVTALLAARPGQLVYLEQPEIHLHPRAQVALAAPLAAAANRGVRVVVETHSSLLLLGVQSLVADGNLSPDNVKLHWFRRGDSDGTTAVTSADMDEAGRFPDWPEDFDDVSLQAQQNYLDSVERRQVAR